MKQKITIELEDGLIRRARVLAAQRRTSIDQILADELIRVVEDEDLRKGAKRKALADLATGFHLGGNPAPRNALHER